jgi:hypothetical protein
VEDCVPNECPNNAACILFDPEVPGCGINDRQVSGQQFCMKTCGSNSDCRDGYECANPTALPWNALSLDINPVQVCIPMPLEGVDGGSLTTVFDPDAAVCQTVGPAFDAAFDAPNASDASDAMTDGPAEESGTDAADSGD